MGLLLLGEVTCFGGPKLTSDDTVHSTTLLPIEGVVRCVCVLRVIRSCLNACCCFDCFGSTFVFARQSISGDFVLFACFQIRWGD